MAETMQIVVPDDYLPLYGDADHPELRRLATYGKVAVWTSRPQDRAEFFRRIEGADVIINYSLSSSFDREALERAPRLRMITYVGVAPNNIDLEATERAGIVVCNLPAINAASVAELSIALMITVARGVVASDRALRRGEWLRPKGFELRGKTLGVLGLGAIGQEVARMGQALRMRVIAWSFRQDQKRATALGVRLVEFDDLFRLSDVLSIHVRASAETRNMISEGQFRLMKPSAILINTARAPIVDRTALVAALREGHLAGAGLDVHEQEPLPLQENVFAEFGNVISTAHLGGETLEVHDAYQRESVQNVIAYLEGNPRNVVRT